MCYPVTASRITFSSRMASSQFEESLTHYESLVADVISSVEVPRVVALVDFADFSCERTDDSEHSDTTDRNRCGESSSSLQYTLSQYRSLVENVHESQTEDEREAVAAPFSQTDSRNDRVHHGLTDSPSSSIKKARLRDKKHFLKKRHVSRERHVTSFRERSAPTAHEDPTTSSMAETSNMEETSNVEETDGQEDATGEILSTVNLVPANDSFNKNKNSSIRPVLNVATEMLLGAIQKRRFFRGHCKWISGVDEEVSNMRFNSLRKACMHLRSHNESPVISINAYRELTLDGRKLSHMIADNSLSRIIQRGQHGKK